MRGADGAMIHGRQRVRRAAGQRALTAVAVIMLCVAALVHLRDPFWLSSIDSGFRAWETAADGTRYRWTGGHASFFVAADDGSIVIPLRTTFSEPTDLPPTVAIAIDDRPVERLQLIDDTWQRTRIELPARGSRRVRRVDIRVDRTRAGNRGVAVGAVQAQ